MVSTFRCFYDSMDVDDNMVDKYSRACGKRISLAEDDLYAGHCSICVTRSLAFIWEKTWSW